MALIKQTYIDLNMGCHLKGKKRSRNHCFLSSVPDCHGFPQTLWHHMKLRTPKLGNPKVSKRLWVKSKRLLKLFSQFGRK